MRSHILRLLLALCLLAAVGGVRAQDITPPSAAVEATPADLALELYDLAFEMLARGDRARATELLTEIKVNHPHDRLAVNAAELLAVLASTPVPEPKLVASATEPSAATKHTTHAKTTAAARAELVSFQSLHGMTLGIETCVLFECEDSRTWAVSIMGGAGAGLGLSFYLSRNGVTGGLARALTAGTEWGAWNALMIGFASDAFDRGYHEEQAMAGGLIVGQLVGLGVGGALYHVAKPTTGQVSLTSSGGIWGAASAGLIALIAADNPDENDLLWTLWAASDIGLIAGGYLASRVPMSTSRVLLIDAGGLLGTLAGGGLGVLTQGDQVSRQLVGTTALIGLLGGLGLTYYLTAQWGQDGDDDQAKLSLGVLPAPGGAMATAHLIF